MSLPAETAELAAPAIVPTATSGIAAHPPDTAAAAIAQVTMRPRTRGR